MGDGDQNLTHNKLSDGWPYPNNLGSTIPEFILSFVQLSSCL